METGLPKGNIKQTRSTNVGNLLFLFANNNPKLEMNKDPESQDEEEKCVHIEKRIKRRKNIKRRRIIEGKGWVQNSRTKRRIWKENYRQEPYISSNYNELPGKNDQ
jgi:hypothetical protein